MTDDARKRDVVARVRRDVEARRAERIADDLCPCPCGRRHEAGSSQRYARGERCKNAAHRELVAATAEALGVPARQSLQSLQTPESTDEGHADAPAARNRPRRPRQGVTVYLPTVELAKSVADYLDALVRTDAQAAAELGGLEGAPALVRAALERRRARGA